MLDISRIAATRLLTSAILKLVLLISIFLTRIFIVTTRCFTTFIVIIIISRAWVTNRDMKNDLAIIRIRRIVFMRIRVSDNIVEDFTIVSSPKI